MIAASPYRSGWREASPLSSRMCNDKFGVRLTTIEMAGLSGFVTEAVAAL